MTSIPHGMILSFTCLPLHLKIPQTWGILTKLKIHTPCLKHELSLATWAVSRHSVTRSEEFRKEDTQQLPQPNIANGGVFKLRPHRTANQSPGLAQATSVFYKVTSNSSQDEHEGKLRPLCKLRTHSRIQSTWARAAEALRPTFGEIRTNGFISAVGHTRPTVWSLPLLLGAGAEHPQSMAHWAASYLESS